MTAGSNGCNRSFAARIMSAGPSEQAYMKKDDAPEITYVNRDTIDRPNEAYTELT